MCVRVWVCEWERERGWERVRERDRETEREKDGERETETKRERETEVTALVSSWMQGVPCDIAFNENCMSVDQFTFCKRAIFEHCLKIQRKCKWVVGKI